MTQNVSTCIHSPLSSNTSN